MLPFGSGVEENRWVLGMCPAAFIDSAAWFSHVHPWTPPPGRAGSHDAAPDQRLSPGARDFHVHFPEDGWLWAPLHLFIPMSCSSPPWCV